MKHIHMIALVLLFLFPGDNIVIAQVSTPTVSPSTSIASPATTPIEYNTLYASAYTDLYKIDPYTGIFTLIGPIGYEGTDIAFDGKMLYGVSFSQLLSIDPTTGIGSLIGYIGYNDVNALTVGPDGTMYAGTVSGALLKINKSNGIGTLIGYYGPGFGSSGDLAIRYDNKMYASITWSGHSTDWLAQIDMNTGRAIPIGDIGEWGVYGIDFKDWSLYGVTTNGYLLEIDTTSGKSTRISTTSADFWGLSTSGPALIGDITSPADNYSTGPATIPITATAQYPGGKSVEQVEFYVYYSGIWQSLGNDLANPYTSHWEIPSDLFTQQSMLRIDVVGTDTKNQIQRASYAGGVRRVNYYQSMGDPNIIEIWVPVRAYLNQRSLSPSGDAKCNVSSIAMILAMDGYISTDYLTMANKANDLAHYLLPDPDVDKECTALRDPVPSAYCSGTKIQADAWSILKKLIDTGHPVIVDSFAATSAGHFIVAIGYKEAFGKHYILSYDPYGEWKGSKDSYYENSTDPASHVGKWVFYEYEKFTSTYVYLFATVAPPSSNTIDSERLSSIDTVQLTPPDQVSDEPKISVKFTGQETFYPQYLPLVSK
jgi:hypothetical protein